MPSALANAKAVFSGLDEPGLRQRWLGRELRLSSEPVFGCRKLFATQQ